MTGPAAQSLDSQESSEQALAVVSIVTLLLIVVLLAAASGAWPDFLKEPMLAMSLLLDCFEPATTAASMAIGKPKAIDDGITADAVKITHIRVELEHGDR